PEVERLEWAKNRNKLKQEVKTHLPDYNLAKALVNKYKLHENLADSSLIPKFSKINTKSYNYSTFTEKLGDVFWVRSTEGSSGLGSLKIESESALSQWIDINQGVNEFIATQYLPGRNMACKMLYIDGELKRKACDTRDDYIMAIVATSRNNVHHSLRQLIY